MDCAGVILNPELLKKGWMVSINIDSEDLVEAG
jgi:hypothetical protein